MDLFEDSAQLVKILLEEGMQPLESPWAAGQELGEGRSRRAAGLGQDSSTTQALQEGHAQEVLSVQGSVGRAIIIVLRAPFIPRAGSLQARELSPGPGVVLCLAGLKYHLPFQS